MLLGTMRGRAPRKIFRPAAKTPVRKKHILPVYAKDETAVGSQSRGETCMHLHILQGFRESEEVNVLLLREADDASLQGARVF
jgi:hypothetical protein